MKDAMFKAKLMRLLDDKEVREILDGIIRYNIQGGGFILRVEDDQAEPGEQKSKIFNLVANNKEVTGIHKVAVVLVLGVPWVVGVIKIWGYLLS